MLLIPIKQLVSRLRINNTHKIISIRADNTLDISSPLAFCIIQDTINNSYNIYLLDLLGIKVIGGIPLYQIKDSVYFTGDDKGIKGIYNTYNENDYLPLESFVQRYIAMEKGFFMNTPLNKWYLQFISTREMYLGMTKLLISTRNFYPFKQFINFECEYTDNLYNTRDEFQNQLKDLINNYPKEL